MSEQNQQQELSDQSLGTDSIKTLFAKIVIPSILAMVIMGIQGMIDGMFLGNFIGPNAMASANIASPFLQIIMGVTMVISIGGTAFIGRTLGAGDENTAKNIFKSCFYSLCVASFLAVVIGLLWSSPIAIALGASPILLEDTSNYIRVIGLFAPFVMLYLLFSFTNRAIGKPELLLISSVACVVGNLCLNYLFIVVLEWEITGAALATGASYSIGFFINLPSMLQKNSVVNVFLGKFSLDLLLKLAYNGSSEGMTSVATAVTTLVFNLTFMEFYGESGVAAFTIVNYIGQFATLLMFGMADGVTPIISYNYGANQKDRVKSVMKIAVIGNFSIGVLAYAVLFFLGEDLIGLYANQDQALLDMTYQGAKIYGISFLMSGFNILISTYFTALGDALQSVVVSMCRGLLFILVGVFTLPHFFQVTGVWMVTPFADLITIFISIVTLVKMSHRMK